MKPRLRPRSRISRLATSQMLRQRLMRASSAGAAIGASWRDRLHEQLRQLRRLVGEACGPRRRPAPGRAARRGRRRRRPAASPGRRCAPGRSASLRPSSHVPSDPTTSTSRWRRPERALSSSMAPAATIRPLAMITTSSHTSSTRSSWWLENTTPTPGRAPARGRPRSSSRCRSGRGRENGSSRTSSSGSWASATASWTRCWLPCDSSSSFDFARSPRPIRSSQRVAAASASRPLQPVLLGEVGELLADPHPRVQAALLGHVAEAQARVAVDRRALPADLAAVRAGQPEDAAHRRRLAGAVRPEEADDAARAGREASRRRGPRPARSAWPGR